MHEHFGRYILLERIAIGGMAEIFKAKAPGLGGFEKIVAIKRLHPRYSQDADFIEMLIDEARITVELSHSNIGQIFDLGKVEDHYFIAMEFIDGRDLYRVMKRLKERNQVFAVDVAAHVAMEACAGLDYAHRKKDGRGRPLHIIHRDVSPQNVLLSYEGDVKLVDFGIAKAALRAYETESGIIKGKFYYMSPEQARGETLDHRTDVFSLGIVLYETLTGDLLYKDDDEVTLLSRVRKAEIEPPSVLRPDLPTELERIVMKALARDREERYPSAQHMQRDLARFLRDFDAVNTKGRLGSFMRELFLDEAPLGDESDVLRDRSDFVQDRRSVISVAAFEVEEDETEVGSEYDSAERSRFESDLMELDTGDIELLQESLGGELPEPWAAVDSLIGPPAADSIELSTEADDPFAAEETRAFVGRQQAEPEPEPVRPRVVAVREPEPLAFNSMPTPVPAPTPGPAPSRQRAFPVPAADPRAAPRPAPAPRSAPASEPDADGFNAQPTVIIPGEAPREPQAPPQRGRRGGRRAETPLSTPMGTDRRAGGFTLTREHILMGAIVLGVLVLAILLTSALLGDENDPEEVAALANASAEPAKVTIPQQPVAGNATLKINSFPSGADVRIDGKWLTHETTPTTLEVAAGRTVAVRVALKNYRPYDTELTIEPGGRREVDARLEKEQGTLTVESRPSGAAILVDGRNVGRTPHTASDLSVDRPVRVRVVKDGFEPYETTVDWSTGRERTIEAQLEPVAVDPPVVAATPPPRRTARRSAPRRRAEPARDPPRARRVARRPAERRRSSYEDRPPARRSSRYDDRDRQPSRSADSDQRSGVGYLSVSSREWGSVFLNGNQIALETPLLKYRVPAGPHEVRVCFGGDRARCSPPRRISVARGKTSVVKF